MSVIIGLTGPTGAGKSMASLFFAEKGYRVVDCDLLSRKAVEKGTEGLLAVVRVFGDDILFEDGTLNRKALAEKAFSTKKNTELLNETILPYILKLVKNEIVDDGVIILDAPTLFESGADSICNATISVLAEELIRLKRIIERDKIDEKSALLRIKAGKNDDFYKTKSDYVLCNNNGKISFVSELENIIKGILKNERKNSL